MLAENTKAFIQKIKDPSRRRYAGAVNSANERGEMGANASYKFYAVGDLTVATVVRPPLMSEIPIYSAFAQDGDKNLSHISGIQLAVSTDRRSVVHEEPQRWIVPATSSLKVWVKSDYVQERLDETEADIFGMFMTESDMVVRMDPAEAAALMEGMGGENDRNEEELYDLRAQHDFFAEMDEAGHNNADPDAVERVSEALEIIVFPGKWRRGIRIARAETLFREGLGLTG